MKWQTLLPSEKIKIISSNNGAPNINDDYYFINFTKLNYICILFENYILILS